MTQRVYLVPQPLDAELLLERLADEGLELDAGLGGLLGHLDARLTAERARADAAERQLLLALG